ncbi:MAG: phosphatidylserine decarboxylase [Acidithiobacillus sp.]|nr:phosphatidylserine decarboxylase [Acidithiobacillus sp.]
MKRSYPYPWLAREGWPIVSLALVLAIVFQLFAWWFLALPVFLFFLFALQFFRDPSRSLPADLVGGVLCPADGRVIAIELVEDPFRQVPSLKVSIFMNVFDVHVNRLPVGGMVLQRWYHPGRFLNASLDKSSLENERNALHLRTAQGQELVVVQVAGLVARRILCYLNEGDRGVLGQRFGFIRFGSRVDTYLPPDSQVLVTLGQRVRSGAQWIAQLPELP